MASYTDEDKALAIGIMAMHDGVLSKQTLKEIRQLLGEDVNKTTLYRWWARRDELGAVATELQPEKKEGATETAPHRQEGPAKAAEGQLQRAQPSRPSGAWMKQTLAGVFAETAMTYLERANDREAVEETKGKDAVTAAAIAADKLLKLVGLPDDLLVLLADIVQLVKARGYEPTDFFMQLKQKLVRHDDD